jgi:hypothetical protein
VNSELITRLGSVLCLLTAGWASSSVLPSASEHPLAERVTAAPLASLVADWSWLKANLAWEAHDEERTRALAAVAMAAASASEYFRINAARMEAFDFPVWQEARERPAPAAVIAQRRREAAQRALDLIAAAPAQSPALLIESGNIALYAARDPGAAADYYRRAAELPGAPWHAGRICAELLHALGRTREAVEWLRAWLPRLPADDPAAQRVLVAERLATWERELARE